jgi:hypothetical protein
VGNERLGQAAVGEPAFQGVRVECDADHLLAKAVVQIVADAGLLALADFEDLAFEAFALGDVQGKDSLKRVL